MAAGCGLRAAGCGLRAAGCGLRAAGCGLQQNGAMATGWQLIDGVWEKLGENGVWEYTWNGQ